MKSASELALGLLVASALLVACSRDQAAPAEHVTPRASVACAGCHLPEFASTRHPPHEGVRPTACGVCHSPSSWHGWKVDHEGWTLTGAHARVAADEQPAGVEKQVKCFWCHREDAVRFKVKDKTCMGCHAADRERAKPPHEAFSTACATCHSTESWKGAKAPPKAKEPAPEPPPPASAGVDAGAAPERQRPKPPKPPATATPTPTPTAKPPDVLTGPSGHRR